MIAGSTDNADTISTGRIPDAASKALNRDSREISEDLYNKTAAGAIERKAYKGPLR